MVDHETRRLSVRCSCGKVLPIRVGVATIDALSAYRVDHRRVALTYRCRRCQQVIAVRVEQVIAHRLPDAA